MNHIYSVSTAKRAGYPHRKYGYVIKIDPPIETISKGIDVEGIGWVAFNQPKVNKQRFFGWYKHKDLAMSRARELNNSKT